MAKKKEPSFHFTIPLIPYPFILLVSVGEPNNKLTRIIKSIGVKNDETNFVDLEESTCPASYAIWNDYLRCAIRLSHLPRASNDYAALAHEICHIVLSVMRRVGMRFDSGDADEAFTYMVSFITEEIYVRFNKYY